MKFKVTPTKAFDFTPDTLVFDIVSQDIMTGTCMVQFRLYEDVPFNTNKYAYREWVDFGQVKLPISVIANAVVDGQLNTVLVQQILDGFNLQLTPDIDEPVENSVNPPDEESI